MPEYYDETNEVGSVSNESHAYDTDPEEYWDDGTYVSATSPDTIYKKQNNKYLHERKSTDNGFNYTHRIVDKKKVTIEYYTIDWTPGRSIRNAVTGCYQRHYKIGSSSENLFFKVINAADMKREQSAMYFDSPEQYERHFKTTVSPVVKEKWQLKYNKEWAKYNK